MPDDVKAEEALAKIKAILTEYDLWGCVTVSSTERTHWLYHVDTSWSCLSLDTNTGEARMRAKAADFKTTAGRDYVIEQTVGAIFNTRDFAAMLFSHMDHMAKIIESQMKVEHHPFTDIKYKRD